jgi:uncharacterized protein YggT (Ycf19 family)
MTLGLILIILYYLLQFYGLILYLSIIMSWVGVVDNRFVSFIRTAADWYLGAFRGFIVIGPLDLSPIIAIMMFQGVASLMITIG